jgi:hypothetical protein
VSASTLGQLQAFLKRTPLRTPARWCRFWTRIVLDQAFFRRQILLWREYRPWKKKYGGVLRPPLAVGRTERRRRREAPKALVVAKGTANGAKIELGLIKGLELAGYAPVVLTERDLAKFYRLGGVRELVYWDEFADRADGVGAAGALRRFRSVDDLLAFTHEGTRVGRFAASTTFRFLRVGHLELSSPETRRVLADHLSLGMIRAAAARRLLQRIQPRLALFLDNRYTGQAELWDLCVEEEVGVITWFEAHRPNTLMLKRYRRENRDQHHASLSDRSWQLVRAMEWTPDRRARLRHEIDHHYATGDWYCRGGTQFNRKILSADRIRERLRLDPRKKTAVVFPHIVWDATLFWGRDLFDNYEEWLVETVRAACGNPRVNWIVKIHPANVVKSAWEGYAGESAEVVAIRERIGELPPHVTLIPAADDINTFSLFDVMDVCVTVRGTIGVEAATLGIAVVTAGSGRYDRKGFTFDSETRQQYLNRLATIEELPQLTPAQRELAERFAYGAFVMRPLTLQCMSIEYARDREARMKVSLNARNADGFRTAPDLRQFADWVAHSTDEDFLQPPESVGDRALSRSA